MARADESPHERDIARAKLAEMGEGWNEPPSRPPVAPGSFDMPNWDAWQGATTSVNVSHTPGGASFVFTIHWSSKPGA
jgi:hypothetical protein